MTWFIEDRGAGEPVLLVTGWTISSAVFDPVAPLYTEHARVISYDHRGTGRSARNGAPIEIAALADDAAAVLDERGVHDAHVVGLSMGSMVALELALRRPGRVRSLVLVGGTAGGSLYRPPDPVRWSRVLGELALDSARHRRPYPAAALFSRRFRREQPERVHELVAPFGRFRPGPAAALGQTVAAATFNRASALGRVRVPTLVLHGDEDEMVPIQNGQAIVRAVPGAELAVIPGAGHAAPLEAADRCAELLLGWVRRHAAAPV